MSNEPEKFGELLRSFREERCLYQGDLALRLAALGEMREGPEISRWETGDRPKPKRKVVLNIGNALQLADHDMNRLLLAAGYSELDTNERSDFLQRTSAYLADIAGEVGEVGKKIETVENNLATYKDDLLAELQLLRKSPVQTRFSLRKIDDDILDNLEGQPFVGRETQIKWLDDFVKTNSKGYALVTAPPGAGKSLLLAKWLNRKESSTYYHTVYHFLSKIWVTDSSFDLLQCLGQQLAAYLEITDESAGLTVGQLKLMVRELLGELHKDKLIVVIDGLDESASEEMGWTTSNLAIHPSFLPPLAKLAKNTFVIFSSRPPATQNAIEFYEGAFGISPILHCPIPELSENDIADLIRASPNDRLQALSNNKDFRSLVHSKTGGLAIYARYLIVELAEKSESNEDLFVAAKSAPDEFRKFVKYGADRIRELGLKGVQWDKALCFLSCAKGALSKDDLCVLVGLELRDFEFLPREVKRWLASRQENNTAYYTFSHPAIAEGYRPDQPSEYSDRLLAFCEQWQQHNSPYALQYLSKHLRDAGQTVKLYELAKDNDFLNTQRMLLPSVQAPGQTVMDALNAALEENDITAISEFLLDHAHLAEQLRTEETLVDALRRGGVERAWSLCDLRRGPSETLSYLMLAFYLDLLEGKQNDFNATVERLIKRLTGESSPLKNEPLLPQQNIFVLLRQALDLYSDFTKQIESLLSLESRIALIKALALRGDFEKAQHWTAILLKGSHKEDQTRRSIDREMNVAKYEQLIKEASGKACDQDSVIWWFGLLEGQVTLDPSDLNFVLTVVGRPFEDENGFPCVEVTESEILREGQSMGMIWPETISRVADVLERYGKSEKASRLRGMILGIEQNSSSTITVSDNRVNESRQIEEDEILQISQLLGNWEQGKASFETIIESLLSSQSSWAADFASRRRHLLEATTDGQKIGNKKEFLALYDLCRVLSRLSVERARRGELSKAIQIIEAIPIKTLAIEASAELSSLAILSGHMEQAKQLLLSSLEFVKTGWIYADVEPLIIIGTNLIFLKMIEPGIQALDLALTESIRETSPNNKPELSIFACAEIGLRLLKFGRKVEASELFTIALKRLNELEQEPPNLRAHVPFFAEDSPFFSLNSYLQHLQKFVAQGNIETYVPMLKRTPVEDVATESAEIDPAELPGFLAGDMLDRQKWTTMLFDQGQKLVRSNDKEGFKKLLIMASDEVNTAYAFLPLLVELYKPNREVTNDLVSKILPKRVLTSQDNQIPEY